MPSWPTSVSRRGGIALVAFAVLLPGCLEPIDETPPEESSTPDPVRLAQLQALSESRVLVLVTEMGTIRALLYSSYMPVTAGRIAQLAASGFYDGTLIHRVVDDFVIQGGDPTGTGEGGSGQTIPFETHPDLPFGIGAVGMAQLTPGTADSQWFITEKPAPHLHDPGDSATSRLGPYPMFGQVIDGMDVVRTISEVAVLPGMDRPVEEIRVTQATLEAAAGIDLLALPHSLEANIALGGGRFHLEQPRFLYALHPFVVQVTVVGQPDPPGAVQVVYRQEGHDDVVVPLEALDEGTVYQGTVALTAGEWTQALFVGGEERTWTRTVVPWAQAYGAFAAPG